MWMEWTVVSEFSVLRCLEEEKESAKSFLPGFWVSSWKASGEVGVCGATSVHTRCSSGPALPRLVPSAGDRLGCSPQGWWDLQQNLATF